jgi:hypothetical protein
MIREDYILGWIKRYIQFLAEILGLMKGEQFQAAIQKIDVVLQGLLGVDQQALLTLSEGEIIARLALDEPIPVINEKCAYLAALLKQLGLALSTQNRHEESRLCLLKSLHLILGLKLQQIPNTLGDYTPTIDSLMDLLKEQPLAPRTYAALMLDYEQEKRFAKAEDMLFAMLESAPADKNLLEIGFGFYRRLQALSDEALMAGDLPREEVEQGIVTLKTWAHSPPA